MNRILVILAALCPAVCAPALRGVPPEDSSDIQPFPLLKPGVAEEISGALKEGLVRKIAGLELLAKLSPENAAVWLALKDAWLKLGSGHLREKNLDDASEAFKKALIIQPGNLTAMGGLAACYVQSGKPNDAIEVIDRALKVDPHRAQPWLMRAFLLMPQNRFVEAGESLAKAEEIDPASKDVHSTLGFLHLQEHKFADAVKEFDLGLKIDPNDASLWSNRGVALRFIGDVPAAIDSRLHALQIDPENAATRREVMTWLLDAGRWDEAAREADEIRKRQPADKESWAAVAQVDLKRGRWSDGVEEMLKAHSLGFNDPKSFLLLSQGYIGLGKFEDAEKTLSTILAADPENANALAYLGTTRQKQKRTEEGKWFSERALEIDPKNSIALMNRVTDCIGENLLTETIRYAERALETDPGKWNAWVAIGLAQEKLGHNSESYAAYKKAAVIAPGQAIGWEGIARFSPDYLESCEAGRKSAKLAPNDPAAQVLLAFAHIRFGKTVEAISNLESVLVRFPENNFARKELETLKPKLSLTAPPEPEPTLGSQNSKTLKVLQQKDEKGPEGTIHTYRILLPKPMAWTVIKATCRAIKRSPDAVEAAQKAAEAPDASASLWIEWGRKLLAISSDEHSIRKASEAETAFRKALELDPKNSDASLWLGVSLFAEGRYREAESLCKKVTAEDPDSSAGWLVLGQSRIGLNHGLEAVEAYEHYVKRWPDNPTGWGMINETYARLEDRKGGEERIRKLLAEFPEAWGGWLMLGQVLSAPDTWNDAVSAFRKSIALKDPNSDAWDGLGGALELGGKSAEAEKAFRRAIEQSPENATSWANLANCYLNQGKIAEAEDACRHAFKVEPKQVAATAILVQVLIKKEDWEAAKAMCDRLEELNPELAGMLRGRILK